MFNASTAILQLYHGETKLIFNELMMGTLCTRQTRLVRFLMSANSVKQKFADRHIAALGHIILIPSQPVFALSP